MNKLLTIIVPSYNMENYLPQCIDSLVVPGFENVEVLIINDGSKDRTSEIAHDYERRYPQSVRCIDKTNGNYGSCINCGLKEMTGKYVKILDADDSFDSEDFKVFLERIENLDTDIIITNFQTVDSDGRFVAELKYSLPSDSLFTVDTLLPELTKTGMHMHTLAYRSGIFREFAYSQTEGISYTDTEWNFIPMHRVATAAFVPVRLYKYLVGRVGQTIDANTTIRNISQLIRVTQRITKFSNSVSDSIPAAMKTYYHNYIYSMVLMVYKIGLLGGRGKCDAQMQDFDRWVRDTISTDDIMRMEQESARFLPGLKFHFLKWYHKSPEHPLLRLRHSVRKTILRR